MKFIPFLIFLFLQTALLGQTTPTDLNKIEFIGNRLLILRFVENQAEALGKLSTGEVVKAGCYDSECFLRIDYKGRIIQLSIDPSNLFEAYEFDFGGDEDKELVLLEYDDYSPRIIVISYSKGNTSLMLQENISPEKTQISRNYIEGFDKTGLPNSVWHYYKGVFWEMTPVDND